MVLHSVSVRAVPKGELCDFCGREAELKCTNRKFFVLVTCRPCWADLKQVIDSFVAQREAS